MSKRLICLNLFRFLSPSFFIVLFFINFPFQAQSHDNNRLSSRKNDFISFWKNYSSISEIQDLNALFVHMDSKLTDKRSQIINHLAYLNYVLETGMLQKSTVTLKKLKKTIWKQDDYVKGIYYLVFAKLLYKTNRKDDAVIANQRAISYIQHSGYLRELKYAYVNQGYYFLRVWKLKPAEVYLKKAEILEKKGIMDFYVPLRCNLHFLSYCKEDFSKLRQYSKEAVDYLHKPGNYSFLDEYRVMVCLATIEELEHNAKMEDYYLGRARNIAVKYNLFQYLYLLDRERAANFVSKNDYFNGYKSLWNSDSIRESIRLEKFSEELAVFDLENKIQIEKLEKKRATYALAVKKRQQNTLLLILTVISMLTIGILFLMLSIKHKNRVLVEQNLKLANVNETRVKSETEIKSVNHEIIVELEKLIYDSKYYKEPHLTIEKIAKKLNTNRTYLSEAINAYYNVGYSNWINEIRINAARKLLASTEYDHYTIEAIAIMVGYSNISSFNSSFKRYTGITPSHFKNQRNVIESKVSLLGSV